ncbi:Acid phosphatase-like protein 2 [Allomyces arbusculus]|nr:Acid phosphatase-like protein 2 [Allomyces arbusculus]
MALLVVLFLAVSTTIPACQAHVAPRSAAPTGSTTNVQMYYDQVVRAMRPLTSSYCQASTPTAANYRLPVIPGVTSLQLETALLFARHGDRAPDHVLVDDLAGNTVWNCEAVESMTMPGSKLVATKGSEALFEEWAPRSLRGTCALGDLTGKGRAMHVTFGKEMRDIYVDKLGFLSRKLSANELNLRATDIGRTVASAQSLLDGMYPHGTYHHDQRVTIRTRPYEVDPLHSAGLDKVCPKLAQLKSLAKKHPMWDQIMNATAASRMQVSTIAPEDGVEPVADATKLGVPAQIENLMCRRCWNKPQPCVSGAGCLSETTVDDAWLVKSLDYWYRNNYFPNRVQPGIVPLEMGPLLREMLAIVDGGNKAKLHVFLAHDGTLSGMLGALRAAPEQHQWPAYRSNLIFEVWSGVEKGVRRKYVRILNDGRSLVTDPELSSDKPWCQLGGEHGETCALDTFRAYLQAHSVDKWDEACRV